MPQIKMVPVLWQVLSTYSQTPLKTKPALVSTPSMKYKNPIPPGLCHKHCLEVQEVQAEIKYIYKKG